MGEGGFFVFLLVAHRDDAGRTFVGVASDPIAAASRHRRELLDNVTRKHKKGSRAAIDWRLEQWIGPFLTEDTAKSFAHLWSLKAKADGSHAKSGARLAVKYDYPCYSLHVRGLRDAVC